MIFTVSPFYIDDDRRYQPWREPFALLATELNRYRATVREILAGMLDESQPDHSQPVGLEILDPTGKLIFTYVRAGLSQV